MLDLLSSPQAWLAFLNLTLLEIILGLDNILFISILSERMPAERQSWARKMGLIGALVTRLLLLFTLSWVVGLTRPLLTIANHPLSPRDLILLGGGLFLLAKATMEIYRFVELHGESEWAEGEKKHPASGKLLHFIVQVSLVDLLFSLDSVITAVGMVSELPIMIASIVVAMAVMLIFADTLHHYLQKNPALRILALAFLIVVGVSLIADGMGNHLPRGYIYFGMGFSLFTELLRSRHSRKISNS